MVKTYVVNGYEAFCKLVKSDELKEMTKYCLFSGDKDKVTGDSWCSDCVLYEPVVRSTMADLKADDAVYIYCLVGGRNYWKDKKNEFRTDPKLMLSGVPTFLKYGSRQKLVESQLTADMIGMMMEE